MCDDVIDLELDYDYDEPCEEEEEPAPRNLEAEGTAGESAPRPSTDQTTVPEENV